jgi:hypothetical protein
MDVFAPPRRPAAKGFVDVPRPDPARFPGRGFRPKGFPARFPGRGFQPKGFPARVGFIGEPVRGPLLHHLVKRLTREAAGFILRQCDGAAPPSFGYARKPPKAEPAGPGPR